MHNMARGFIKTPLEKQKPLTSPTTKRHTKVMSNVQKMEVLMKMNKTLLFAALLAAFSQTMPIYQGMPQRTYKPGQPVPEGLIFNEIEPGIMLTDAKSEAPAQPAASAPQTDAIPTPQSTLSDVRRTIRASKRKVAEVQAAVTQANAVVEDEGLLGRTPDSRPPVDHSWRKQYLMSAKSQAPDKAADLGFRKYRGDVKPMLGGNGREAYKDALPPVNSEPSYSTATNPDGSLKPGFHWEQEGKFKVAVRDNQTVTPSVRRIVGGKGSYTPLVANRRNRDTQ